MNFWWVNQNQTHRQEIAGGYLWSPKVNANGARNPFYEFMREVAPGDLVFSFADTLIIAIGVVRSYCAEAPKPAEFGTTGAHWNQIGWRVNVEWRKLIHQIRPKDYIDLLKPHLPEKYSPLRSTGDGLQGVYLTYVPSTLASVLGGLIGPEFEVFSDDVEHADGADTVIDLPAFVEEWEEHLVEGIRNDEEIQPTTRVALIQARVGQGQFRQSVGGLERRCRITGVENPSHLIASHCKPWRDCEDRERLDPENGLMLTPSIDHLFDRGFISFEGSGNLLISPVAHRPSLQRMGIRVDEEVNVGGFTSGQRHYLEFHQESVFLQRRT